MEATLHSATLKGGERGFSLNKLEYIPKSQKFSKVPNIMYKVALNLKNEKEVLLNEKLDPPDKILNSFLYQKKASKRFQCNSTFL